MHLPHNLINIFSIYFALFRRQQLSIAFVNIVHIDNLLGFSLWFRINFTLNNLRWVLELLILFLTRVRIWHNLWSYLALDSGSFLGLYVRHLWLKVHLDMMVVWLVQMDPQLAGVPKILGTLNFISVGTRLNLNRTNRMSSYRILPNRLLNRFIFLSWRASNNLLWGVFITKIKYLMIGNASRR